MRLKAWFMAMGMGAVLLLVSCSLRQGGNPLPLAPSSGGGGSGGLGGGGVGGDSMEGPLCPPVLDPDNPDDVECDPIVVEDYIYDGQVIKVISQNVILNFLEGTTQEQKNDLYLRHGVLEVDDYAEINSARVVTQPGQSVQQAVLEFSAEPIVEVAEPNALIPFNSTIPNDPYFPAATEQEPLANKKQWHLINLEAHKAWDITRGNRNLTATVIDTGVDRTHPDFCRAHLWWEPSCNDWSNFPNDSMQIHQYGISAGDDRDKSWCRVRRGDVPKRDRTKPGFAHGTAVAGEIGAATNNNLGVAGGAWDLRILPAQARAWYNSQQGVLFSTSAIVNAVNLSWCGSPKVINMSLGGDYDWRALRREIAWRTMSSQVVIVASAGNLGPTIDPNKPTYPAAYPNVEAVAGLSRFNHKSSGSKGFQAGNWIDVSGYYGGTEGCGTPQQCGEYPNPYPHAWIVTTDYHGSCSDDDYEHGWCQPVGAPFGYTPGDYFEYFGGTSAAAPMISAEVILIFAQFGEQSRVFVHAKLMESADPTPLDTSAPGHADYCRAIKGLTDPACDPDFNW